MTAESTLPGLLGNHQKCWLWGRNTVRETLAHGRWPILELYLAESLPSEERHAALHRADALGIPVFIETKKQLERKCHQPDHQGYLAKMAEFPYADAACLLSAPSTAPLWSILDQVHDAFNFGAMIRSAEVFGLDALFIGEISQVGVTSHVARSSSGAVNRIPIARTTSLPTLAKKMKQRGITLVGASEKADTPLTGYDFTRPTAIVLGNEGHGLSPAMHDHCTHLLRIPQHGHIGSLNAAVAAAIFFYEARRQRHD